jgi:hypothetical protein
MHIYAQAPKQQPGQTTTFAPPRPLAEGSGLRPARSQRQPQPCVPAASFDVSRVPVYSPATPVIQMKLTVNAPGDAYEREADRIAEEVLQMPEPGGQRACAGGCSDPPNDGSDADRKRVQTKRLGSSGDGVQAIAPPSVETALHSPGRPLDAAARTIVEPRFGFDFSQVRIHTDPLDAQSARDVNAHAYTVGRDIVFGAGRFAPETQEGQRLLAHELTHVIQQGHNNPSAPHLQRQTPKNAPDIDAERDRAAAEAMAGVGRSSDELIAEAEAEEALRLDRRRNKDSKYAQTLGWKDKVRVEKKGGISPKHQREMIIHGRASSKVRQGVFT